MNTTFFKTIAACLLVLMLPMFGHAQAQALKQSTATEIQILAMSVSTGLATTTTNSIPTGFTIALTKHADSGIPTVTAWTPTLPNVGTHDCQAVANGKEWTCELTATDTGTLGRLDVCASYPGAYDRCNAYTVISSNSWNEAVSGTGVETLRKGVAFAGFPIRLRRTGTAITPVTGATITCTRSVNNGSGFSSFASTGISNPVEIGNGHYSIDLDNTVVGNTTIIRCTAIGGNAPADPYEQYIFGQR